MPYEINLNDESKNKILNIVIKADITGTVSVDFTYYNTSGHNVSPPDHKVDIESQSIKPVPIPEALNPNTILAYLTGSLAFHSAKDTLIFTGIYYESNKTVYVPYFVEFKIPLTPIRMQAIPNIDCHFVVLCRYPVSMADLNVCVEMESTQDSTTKYKFNRYYKDTQSYIKELGPGEMICFNTKDQENSIKHEADLEGIAEYILVEHNGKKLHTFKIADGTLTYNGLSGPFSLMFIPL